jgi:hypothetical protein
MDIPVGRLPIGVNESARRHWPAAETALILLGDGNRRP